MLTNIIIAACVYVILYPVLFWGLGFADKKYKAWSLSKKMSKPGANKNRLAKEAPENFMPKWKERLKFTKKDKRPFVIAVPKKGKEPVTTKMTRRMFYWVFRGVGFIIALIGGLIGGSVLVICLLVSAIVYIITLVYGFRSADKLLKIREKVTKKMFAISKAKLGQSSEYESNPGQVVRITDWRDMIKPNKVEFDIPETFGEEGAEGFMRLFNQNFGKETAWVPFDDEETKTPGWNFEDGVLTIRAVPPLPQKAPWDEHYVLSEGIAWSFFPIALGVSGGVELPNPKTGETENVLGFDFSGEQAKVGQKAGLKVSGKIVVAPQALVGGSTGGGKALSVDTPVYVVDNEDKEV